MSKSEAHAPRRTSSKSETKTLPLSEFHQLVDSGADQNGAASLPRGPGDAATAAPEARTRKWVVEVGAGDEDGRSVYRSAPLDFDDLPIASGGAAAVVPLDEFKASLDLCLREFTSGGDVVEATRCIVELGGSAYHLHIVKRGILLAMDKAGREREMIAELLDSLFVRGVLTSQQVADGFESLLASLDDLLLDTPEAPRLLAHFLADAILDRLVPPTVSTGWSPELTASPPVAAVLEEVSLRLLGRVANGGAEVRAAIRSVVKEYLVSHDATEVARRLDELKIDAAHQHEVVRAAVEVGLDRNNQERELISQLISYLYDVLPPAQIARAFEQLVLRVDDLTMDNPQASSVLAAFLVRAVADDVLPPAFVRQAPPESLTSERQLATLTQARAQLAAAHFGEKRRKVWGAAADADIATLKHSVSELVREYLVGGEADEAVRCIIELEAPSFMHEVVKRLVVLSLDHSLPEQALARALLGRLHAQALLSPEQLALGCKRLLEALPDLRLDNPRAADVLAEFLEYACHVGALVEPPPWREAARLLRAADGDDAAALAAVTTQADDAPAA